MTTALPLTHESRIDGRRVRAYGDGLMGQLIPEDFPLTTLPTRLSER